MKQTKNLGKLFINFKKKTKQKKKLQKVNK